MTTSMPAGGIIPLYDYDYDPARAAARVDAGTYQYATHNCASSITCPPMT